MSVYEPRTDEDGRTWPAGGALSISPAEIRKALATADLPWATRRMLQALDAYWLHYDGLPRGRNPRSMADEEYWWGRYEKYRKLVEQAI